LRHEDYHRVACNYFNHVFHMVGEKYIWGRYLSGCRVRIWRFLVGAIFFLAFLQ